MLEINDRPFLAPFTVQFWDLAVKNRLSYHEQRDWRMRQGVERRTVPHAIKRCDNPEGHEYDISTIYFSPSVLIPNSEGEIVRTSIQCRTNNIVKKKFIFAPKTLLRIYEIFLYILKSREKIKETENRSCNLKLHLAT